MNKKIDYYQEITDRFIKAIEAGTEPWKCPWDQSGNSFLPVNALEKDYHGINVMLLWAEQSEKGYHSNQWMTYKQAEQLGGQVKAKEQGTQICFFKPFEITDKNTVNENGVPETRTIPLLKTYTVFNREQIENLPEINKDLNNENNQEFDVIKRAEQVLKDSKVEIKEGGSRAFYLPAIDEISMPDRNRFESNQSYYATAFHELTHATKHSDRCNRKPYETKIAKASYAFEELVAEIGSVFTMAHLNLQGEKHNHESYVASWLKVLKEDKKAIFKAASQAQKACNWIKEQSTVFDKDYINQTDIAYPTYPDDFSLDEKFIYSAADGNLQKVKQLVNNKALDLNKTEPDESFLSVGEKAVHSAGLGKSSGFKKGQNKEVVEFLSLAATEKLGT